MKKFLGVLLAVTTVMVLVPLFGSAEAVVCVVGTLTDYLPGGSMAGCTQQDKIWTVSAYSGGVGNPVAANITVTPQSTLVVGGDLHALEFSSETVPWTVNFTMNGSIAIVPPPGDLYFDDAKFSIGTCIFGNNGCTGHVDGTDTLSGGTARVLATNFGPNPGVTSDQAFYTRTQSPINWFDSFTFTAPMQLITFTDQFSETLGAPVPSTLLLLGGGLVGLGLMRKRIRRR